jgi:transcriptional regulator with XRE-family HTH domain
MRLAFRAGLCFRTIVALEEGRTRPHRRTLERLARGLNMPVADLVGPLFPPPGRPWPPERPDK